MDYEDAKRWKSLEQRARDHGWTIDLLTDGKGTPARTLEFALTELTGSERALVIGDLDTIEAFL
jgi:hypothetical protein